MAKGDDVVRVALAEVGVTEVPLGSNSGPRVRQYQQATSLGGTGWPWCAAFVEWCWKRVGGIDTAVCSPSTQVFADNARRMGLTGAIRPGAAVCWEPRHVEIAVSPTTNKNIWHCVGGNVSDGVRRTVRDVRNATIIVPKELLRTPVRASQYWFEDKGAHRDQRMLGPWRGNAGLATARKVAENRRKAGQRALVKRVGPGQRFGVLVGPPTIYGPWADQASRNRALSIIAKRTGRIMRPYSTAAPLAAASAQQLNRIT